MSDDTLRLAVRHSCWANLELIAFCAKLPAEDLTWTVPGTFGTIHRTLQHTVGAEQGYLFRITGQEPPRGMFKPDVLVGLDELADRERSVRDRAEALLSGPFDDAALHEGRSARASGRVIVAQLVHHGSDHRAHVGTILGAHGVEPPDLDVWAYGTSIGEVVEIAPPRT
jgi:uncharacterized damage-inducible protein DinB